MTSKRIEGRIASLGLNIDDFKKNITLSIKLIDELRKKFTFDRQAQSMGVLSKAVNSVTLAPISKSVDATIVRFTALGVATAEVIRRITNGAIDAGKALITAFTITPIKQGLSEYETQINAIQTILANTKKHGTNIQDVNAALDELNEYADRTIYNFTEMTSAIGRFTTAGVNLDNSVLAIKGISNLAAVSGANAQEAARAQYQLSQALSSGIIKLMDWNSVVNANMGGQIFQDAIMETARVHGVAIDAIIARNGSFRDSLQEGWFTSDILLETLQKFTGDMTEEQLRAIGYTEEQIKGILELGEMANDAATKIKTYTQFIDTMKEALQSGWAQSWRLIIGDFEQAKELFGDISGVFEVVITSSANARNKVLEQWNKFGGRDIAIEGLLTILKTLVRAMSLAKEAIADVFPPVIGYRIVWFSRKILEFVKTLQISGGEAWKFKNIIRGIASIVDIFRMAIVAILRPIFELFGGVNALGKTLFETASDWGLIIFRVRNAIKETRLFDHIVTLAIGSLKYMIRYVLGLANSFMELEVVKDITNWFKSLTRDDYLKFFETLKTILGYIISPFIFLGAVIRDVVKDFLALERVQEFLNRFKYDKIKLFLNELPLKVALAKLRWAEFRLEIALLRDELKRLWGEFMGSKTMESFMTMVDSFKGRGLQSFIDELKQTGEWIPKFVDWVKQALEEFSVWLDSIDPQMQEAGRSIERALGSVFGGVKKINEEVSFDGLAEMINATAFGALAYSISKALSGSFLVKAIKQFFVAGQDITDAITGAFGALESTMVSIQTNLKADALLQIAKAIAILAAVMIVISLLDADSIVRGAAGMGILIAELVAGIKGLSMIRETSVLSITAAIMGLSVGLLVLSGALWVYSRIDPQAMTRGMTSVGIVIGGFVATMKGLNMAGSVENIFAVSAALVVLSLAVYGMSFAIKKFGEMDYAIMERGMVSVGVVLAGFAAFSAVVNSSNNIETALAIGILVLALMGLEEGLGSLGALNYDEIERGLIAMGGSLAILTASVFALSKVDGGRKGARALSMLASSMYLLAGALNMLAQLTWEQILRGLVAFGIALAAMAVVGYLLGPVAPAIIAVAAGVALFGLATLLFGTGLWLAATGLAALSASALTIGPVIKAIGESLSEVLPQLGTAFAQSIANFVVTLAENAPRLQQAFKDILVSMLLILYEMKFDLVLGIIDIISEFILAIGKKIPEFVKAGAEILLELMRGVRDNIKEVVVVAVETITEFINGLNESLPLLVPAAFDLVETLTTSIWDELQKRALPTLEKVQAFVESIISGIKIGLDNKIQEVLDWFSTLGSRALDALKRPWDAHSPSREAIKLAMFVGEGLIIGVGNMIGSVTAAFEELGSAGQNGMAQLLNELESQTVGGMNLTPVIKPTLDLTDYKRGMRGLNLGKAGVRFNPLSNTSIEETAGSSTSPTYVFNQYNTSPRSLARSDIYRQTKLQLSKLRFP